MPSNEDLIKSIEATAKAADVDVPETKDLNNKELGDMLKSLKLKVTPETQTAKVKKPPYEVAKGKSLATRSGVKVGGDEIAAKDLTGGEDTLKALVEKKYVVKNK